jgi:hypothetical protein
MEMTRRNMLAATSASALTAFTRSALGGWEPSERYPDPAIKSLDPSFNRYRLFNASIERLATGMRWCEGPVFFGDARCLIWSDILNNRLMRYDSHGRIHDILIEDWEGLTELIGQLLRDYHEKIERVALLTDAYLPPGVNASRLTSLERRSSTFPIHIPLQWLRSAEVELRRPGAIGNS